MGSLKVYDYVCGCGEHIEVFSKTFSETTLCPKCNGEAWIVPSSCGSFKVTGEGAYTNKTFTKHN